MTLVLDGFEATNVCNLSCGYCCNKHSKYPQGYIDDATVQKAMRHCVPSILSPVYGVGECLLHPKIAEYARWFTESGLRTYISTNGLLLTEAKFRELLAAGVNEFSVSIHHRESARAYLMACRFLKEQGINIVFHGNIMAATSEHSYAILQEEGMSEEEAGRLRTFHTMDWAGIANPVEYPPEIVAQRKAKCFYINNDIVTMKWDGTVVSCCLDADATNRLGHIDEFASLRHTPDAYELCKFCGTGWYNEYT